MRANRVLAVAIGIALPTASLAASGVAALDAAASVAGSHSLADPVSPSAGFELTSQQGDSNVTLKLSSSISGIENSSMSLTVEAPIAKKGKTTTLGSLDGLKDATTVELKLTRVVVHGIVTDHAAQKAFCRTVLTERYLAKDKKNKAEDVECKADFAKPHLGTDDFRRFKKLGFSEDAYMLSMGLAGKGGYQDFEYFDGSDLSKQTVRKSPWSAGAFVSYASIWSDFLLLASFKAQDAYKDADSKTLCPGTASTGPIECISGPIGLPNLERKHLLTLEGRKYVSKGLAFALALTRDFKNKVSGVQLPVYFIGDGEGGLTGGVRLDWSSDNHKTTVGVFVGQAFKLLD